MLEQLAKVTGNVFVWTQFSNETFPKGRISLISFKESVYKGRLYQERGFRDPLSALGRTSFWPFEDDPYRMVRGQGFDLEVLARGISERPPVGASHCLFLARKH